MPRYQQALKIAALTGVLALGGGALLSLGPWGAQLAETNYQANMIRLQRFFFDAPPRTVLVGSSLTGRLLPTYFDGSPIGPVANLGIDGVNPLFGLELVRQRPPAVVVVEENTVLVETDANRAVLVEAMRGPAFRLARYVPLLRARARPSSILYTWIKTRRNAATPPPAAAASATDSPAGPTNAAASDPRYAPTRDALRMLLQALRAHSCRVVLVRLPAGYHNTAASDPAFALGEEMAKEFALAEYDLTAECESRGRTPQYTDGHHLTPASAREVSRVLSELLARPASTAQTRSPITGHAP